MALIPKYEAPVKENPYLNDIDTLIDAGEGAAWEFKGTDNERLKFQAAARHKGYTARVMEKPDEKLAKGEKGRFVFVLRPAQKSGPRPAEKTPAIKPGK